MSATTAGTPQATQRRPRLVVIVLALSLALNLFFVGGAAWIRLHPRAEPPGIEQRYQRLAAELGLDAQQRAAFDIYVAAMRSGTAKMREQSAPVMSAAWDEIGKPQADAAQVNTLLDEAAAQRRVFQREATAQTLAFLAVLSPEQRLKFVAISRERRGGWRSR